MTLCPIAIVAGCQKCPAFRICPVKSLLGDVPKTPPPVAAAKPASKPVAKPRSPRNPVTPRKPVAK